MGPAIGVILLTWCSIAHPSQCIDRPQPLYSMTGCNTAIVKAPTSAYGRFHTDLRFTRWRCVFGKRERGA